MNRYIEIRGARLHNLKNIDVRIRRGQLVVITGPSGSGKSTLAFDTLFAEGQRRYIESLSTYSRQFLQKMAKPDVDEIIGICPAIAIQQKAPSGNPRSTVGTVTEIYDYLRLLYTRIGRILCTKCNRIVKKEDPGDVLKAIEKLEGDKVFYIAFPLKTSELADSIDIGQRLKARGYLRIWQKGGSVDLRTEAADFSDPEIYIIVNRGRGSKTLDRTRYMDSIEMAFREGGGFVSVISPPGDVLQFNRHLVCGVCGTKMIEPEPRLFSFNNPFGACPGCQGFGDMTDLDIDKIIPDPSRSLQHGAIVPWTFPSYQRYQTRLIAAAMQKNIPLEVPFRDLSPEQQNFIIEGDRSFPGVRGFFKKLEKKKYRVHVRVFISRYRSYFTCTRCHGQRLRPEALAVRIENRSISDAVGMSIGELYHFLSSFTPTKFELDIAGRIMKEIKTRVKFLLEMGLDYLHLDRRSNTLSGGEFQRINLVAALGSALSATLYILDEPTIGLHPRDTDRLIGIMKKLCRSGNTTVVVEHDRSVMEQAGQIIDLGPAAGARGGQIMFNGGYRRLIDKGESLTADYLRGIKRIPARKSYRKGNGKHIVIEGAREHNLKNITARIPLGKMVCITGVSGSGKSTLIEETLYSVYHSQRGESVKRIGAHDRIRGFENLSGLEMVDQSPIGRTPRSVPVTYIKAFDVIRKLFAGTAEAGIRGLTAGHFSFNVPGGRCDVCEGDGQIKYEMFFLADVFVTCEACQGKRFKKETLQVRYRGKNIHDVLNMTVDEAVEFFKDRLPIANRLKVLQKIGLGYLKLGQPAPTLSGGEAQRIKLAAHLCRKSHRDVLFIFDEPSTGLHFHDIANLISAFDELVDGGASVLIIEHNVDIIRRADWVIDLGPEGGDAGGEIVAEGTPAQIKKIERSYTGRFL